MSTALSASSTATPSAIANGCSSVTYDIPVQDIACAIANIGASANNNNNNNTAILNKCCGSAPVTQYQNNCAGYCIAAGKTAGDLSSCFQSEGAKPAAIFCNGNLTATATGKPSSTAGSKTASSSTNANTATGSGTATKGSAAPQSFSKSGLGLVVMVFLSAAAGTLL